MGEIKASKKITKTEEIELLKKEIKDLEEDLVYIDNLLTETKALIKKSKMKWVLWGIGACVAFGVLIAAIGVIAYMNGFFDDNGGQVGLTIDRNVDTSNNRTLVLEETPQPEAQPTEVVDDYIQRQTDKILETINDGYSEAEAVDGGQRETQSLLDEVQLVEQSNNPQSSQELPSVVEQPQPTKPTIGITGKLTANDIDLVNLWDNVKDNVSAKDFLTTYYFLYNRQFNLVDFGKKWGAYDLANKYTVPWDTIKKARPQAITAEVEQEYLVKKASIVKEMNASKLDVNKTALVINPCFYSFCKENEQVYAYVKKAMINDTELKNQLLVAKKDGVSPKFYLTILLIENIRMHTQYKGAFKSVFMKYASPKLAVMSKFSYGKYGTKVNFITQLMNNNYKENSIFSIGDFPVLKELKDSYYWQDKNGLWHPKKESTIIEWLVNNKQAQTDIISAFFKMAQKGWSTKGVDLWKAENAGILLTLYNIGKLGEPKENPELWGATLQFVNQKYNFWQLANVIYNSLELDDITQQMWL